MADPIVPTPDLNEGGDIGPVNAAPPPQPGTQSTDPGGSSYERQPDAYDQLNAQYLEPFLQQYVKGFSTDEGRQRALNTVNELRMHFYQKEMADRSSLAGQQAVTDTESTINGFATMARDDPSASDLAMQAVEDHVKAVASGNPNLTAEQAAQLSNEYVQRGKATVAMAHYYGLANRTPEVALSELKQGRYMEYLTQGQAEAIQMHAQTVMQQQAEGAKAQAEALERQQKADFNKASTAITLSMFQPDGSIAINRDTYSNIQALGNMPGATPSEIKGLMGMAAEARRASITGEYVADDPHTMEQFRQRMLLPQGTPGALTNSDIYGAVIDKRLSSTTARQMVEARDRIANDPDERMMRSNIERVVTQLKSTITNANALAGTIDPLGNQMYAQYLSAVEQRITQLRNSGMKATDIEKTLLDPRSPVNIMNEAARYTPTKAQSQAAINAWSTTGLPPIAPINDPYLSSTSSAKAAGGAPSFQDFLKAKQAQQQPKGK